MAKIRILLADDHTLFRQGIRHLISNEADMEVIGEAPNGGDAVEKAAELRDRIRRLDERALARVALEELSAAIQVGDERLRQALDAIRLKRRVPPGGEEHQRVAHVADLGLNA